MATFPTANDVLRLLPNGTVVQRPTLAIVVADAISRIAECHESGVAPATDRTVGLVWRYALARAWKQHYMQGEAYVETPTIDTEIAAAEADILAYCATARAAEQDQGGSAQVGQDSGIAYIESSPF